MVADTRAGRGGTNEDRWHVGTSHALVLDGASSVRRLARDGAWYADQLRTALTTALVEEPAVDLREALATAITSVSSLGGVTAAGPTCATALVRWTSEILDGLILGDATAVVFDRTGNPTVYTDDRLSGVAPELRADLAAHLAAGHGFDEAHRRRLACLQEAERAARNRPGGYWIAGNDPGAAYQSLTWQYPVGEAAAVLLATDGFAAAVNRFNLCDWRHLNHAAQTVGLDPILAAIAQAEDEDPTGSRWPRGKRSDDKTAVLIEFR